MAGFRIEGDTSANVAEVDSNKNLKVTLPSNPLQAGYMMLGGELSNSADPHGAVSEKLRVSAQGRLSVGQPVELLKEIFHQTVLNSAVWTAPATTMTVVLTGGAARLNASGLTTANAVARIASYQNFSITPDFALYTVFDARLSQVPQANSTTEFGFVTCATTAAPTDGAFFRYDAAGTLKAVLNTNGTELTSSPLTAPAVNEMHRYKIVLENDRALYFIDGACQAIIDTPVSSGTPIYSSSVPWAARHFNSASIPTLATIVSIGYVFVGYQDAVGLNRDVRSLNTAQGKMSQQGQSGHTMGSTALYSNSLAAGAGAAATNTTAALGSGLGGQFTLLPTLAANTDGIISSYQNPLPTSAIGGKTLFITGLRVSTMVTTTLVGGPVLMAHSLAFGHTAVSLATTETATTKSPRRHPIGFDNFAAAAALGTMGKDHDITFNSPIAINPGEFVQVVSKNIGTVTTLGAITYLISFDGYWE